MAWNSTRLGSIGERFVQEVVEVRQRLMLRFFDDHP